MFDEFPGGNVGEARVAILEGANVDVADVTDELLLQGSVHVVVLAPDAEVLFMVADGLSNYGSCGKGRNDWRSSRVGGLDEGSGGECGVGGC